MNRDILLKTESLRRIRDLQLSIGDLYDWILEVCNKNIDFEKQSVKIEILCSESFELTDKPYELTGHCSKVIELVSTLKRNEVKTLTEEDIKEKVKKPKAGAKKMSKVSKRTFENIDLNEKSSGDDVKTISISEYWNYKFSKEDEIEYRMHRNRYRIVRSRDFSKSV